MFRVVALALFALSTPLTAQQTDEGPLAVVQRLFDAMHAKDSIAIAATFDSSAKLLGHVRRGDSEFVSYMSAADFARRIATIPATTAIEERIWESEVRIDADLASVWTPYAFYINGELSHCGVDAVMLMRFANGWRIVALADTRQNEGCEVPAPAPQRN